MSEPFNITIDNEAVSVTEGQTILAAARKLGIDIPTLCHLEKCGPLNSCLVCLVKVNGKLVPSCGTKVQPGMAIESETNEVHDARRTALELLFSDHVGDCLSPCHRLCPLRMNIPVMLRQIEAGDFDQAIITVREALPLAAVLGRLCHHPCEQGCRRSTWDDPAAIRDLERMVADKDLASTLEVGERAPVPAQVGAGDPPIFNPPGATENTTRAPYLPFRQPASGKSVVIIGSGPTGLAAAYELLKQGHACTVVDRQKEAGGTLRSRVSEQLLPRTVLNAEINQIERLGAQFKLGVALGSDLTLEGLLRGFDAVLVAFGELSKAEGASLGLTMAATGIQSHPETYETNRPAVFAAGRAVKQINQLVRAMSEGQLVAECIHQFLTGNKVKRREKPFSSIMGRLDGNELKLFLKASKTFGSVSPCDSCAGFTKQEAATEASRCLHCDCRSSGDCALQFYAQAYRADASRYRQQRRKFEQYLQPGGVIFEPGKCILCGICVKLTELAREPLGLTFIGRGFEVRIATPFNRGIEEGLQNVAAECVKHCPTGALAFKESPGVVVNFERPTSK